MGRKRALDGREEEVVQLWESEMGIYSIGKKLGVAGSTVVLELERLGLRERPTKEKIQSHFEAMKDTEEFCFVLGIAWAIGSMTGEKFVIRNKNKDTIEKVCSTFRYISGPYRLKNVRNQWACHFSIHYPMYEYMEKLGWSGRWDKDRCYPNGKIDDASFIRGFVSQHISVDTIKNQNRIVPRIRIYGAKKILSEIDNFFVAQLGTSPKKIQDHGKSEVMKVIYYTSKREVPVILYFLELQRSLY